MNAVVTLRDNSRPCPYALAPKVWKSRPAQRYIPQPTPVGNSHLTRSAIVQSLVLHEPPLGRYSKLNRIERVTYRKLVSMKVSALISSTPISQSFA